MLRQQLITLRSGHFKVLSHAFSLFIYTARQLLQSAPIFLVSGPDTLQFRICVSSDGSASIAFHAAPNHRTGF
jgi:hypothetical protein